MPGRPIRGRQRRLGQRVKVLIGYEQHPGTVVGVNSRPQEGVEVDLDYPVNGLGSCYAIHEEVRPLRRSHRRRR